MRHAMSANGGRPSGRASMQIRRITLAALPSAAAACIAGNRGNQDSQFMDSRRGTAVVAGGLVISSPLVLDNAIVAAAGTLTGTVTYQNTGASPIAVQTIGIAARPPGGTNAGGPYTNLAPSLPAQTIQPGASVTLAASRAFTSSDKLGSWYSYTTWQDAAGAWHDSSNINFTVSALPAPAGGLVPSSPLTLDKLTVAPGDVLNGTVTYQNTSASPIVVQTVGIGMRPPGGGNAGGPFTQPTPPLPPQTIQPGATVTLAASRTFTSADPIGSWYSYTTWQDAAGGWHDSTNLNFTVTAPPVVTPPVVTLTASPPDPTTASFSFTSDKAGSTFLCSLDSGAATSCTSPQSYSGLAVGSHTFTVTAADQAGNVSAPASCTWTITSAGGLVISSPLVLRTLSVMAGDNCNGRATYQKTSANPTAIRPVGIAAPAP